MFSYCPIYVLTAFFVQISVVQIKIYIRISVKLYFLLEFQMSKSKNFIRISGLPKILVRLDWVVWQRPPVSGRTEAFRQRWTEFR